RWLLLASASVTNQSPCLWGCPPRVQCSKTRRPDKVQRGRRVSYNSGTRPAVVRGRPIPHSLSEAAMSPLGLRRPCRASFLVAALLTALAAAGLLLGAAAEGKKAEEKVKPIRALLVIGGCCHDYAKQKDILAKGLSNRAHVEVTVAYDPDTTTK